MSIDALARELIERRQTAKRLLDAGEIDGWLQGMPAEFEPQERLRSHLLNHPVVVTDDPAVSFSQASTLPSSMTRTRWECSFFGVY